MKKARLPTRSSENDHTEGRESREPCACRNCDFVSHVCRQCQKLICIECLSKQHKLHKTDKVNVVADELRNDIGENVSKETNSDVLDTVLKSKDMIAKMRNNLITFESNEMKKIDKRINELHAELDKIRIKYVEIINVIVRKDIDHLKKIDRNLDKTALSIKSMLDAARSMLEKANDIDIVKSGYSMCESLKDISKTEITTSVKCHAFNVQFVPRKSDKHELKSLFGEVIVKEAGTAGTAGRYRYPQHKVSPDTMPEQLETKQSLTPTRKESRPRMYLQLEEKQTIVPIIKQRGSKMAAKTIKYVLSFSVSDIGGVQRLCAAADEKCWYSNVCDDIQLVDMIGTRHRYLTLTGGFRGITTTDDGSVYVTCFDRSIRKISTDDKMTNFQTSLPFPPLGLTVFPATGELLVCGWNGGVFSVTKGGIQRTLTDVEFRYALDIAVNNNGDICVIDTNNVYIFNSNKRHIGTYDGRKTSIQSQMDPVGVTCDSRGHFIVTDYKNRVLHVINRKAGNVSIYDTTQDCEERPLFVDISPSGLLWVSFDPNKINIYNMK